MFDARSLLEMMVKGQGQPAAPQAGASADPMGQLGDLLRQFTQGQGGAAPGAQPGAPSGGAGGGLEDLLRNMLPGGGQPQAPGAAPQPSQPSSGGGLGDIFGQIQN